jgi:F0F1-type ATP synthase membrane subunit a
MASASAAAGQGPTAGEYIVHHLTHLQNKAPAGPFDLGVFNFDSIVFAVTMGLLGCFFLWRAARKATSGVPGRFQAAVEVLVEMVESQAKGIVHNAQSRKLVSPLALTVFVWIFLMNAMDLLPVDLLPVIWEQIVGARGGDTSHAILRVVPTADLSVTMGLSLSVLIICIIYNIKIKGAGGWAHELFTGAVRQPLPAVAVQLPDAAHRVRRQDGLARHAAVRQHVRGRVDLHADRPDGRGVDPARLPASSWRSAKSSRARRGHIPICSSRCSLRVMMLVAGLLGRLTITTRLTQLSLFPFPLFLSLTYPKGFQWKSSALSPWPPPHIELGASRTPVSAIGIVWAASTLRAHAAPAGADERAARPRCSCWPA